VVNMVILRLFVFAKWVFLLVMLKPQSFLLLEKFALFVIVLVTLPTPVIKSMGSLLATNSPIENPQDRQVVGEDELIFLEIGVRCFLYNAVG